MSAALGTWPARAASDLVPGTAICARASGSTFPVGATTREMLGAEFERHGTEANVDVRVEDRSHPSTASLGSAFRLLDEIYEFRANPRANVHVLLSLDRHPDDGHPEAGQPDDLVLAWFKTYGAGRVFYTALGHRDEVWRDPRFLQHLAGALRWAFE